MKKEKGFTIIQNELFLPCQLSVEARLLLAILIMHCGQDDFCFPSQDTLGKEMGFSDRHIRNILKELEKHELITRSRSGYNRPNTYKVAKKFVRIKNRKTGSYQLGSKFPLNEGKTVPTKNTYTKAKGKRSLKGFQKIGDLVLESGWRKV